MPFRAAICGKTQGKRASFVSRNVAYCHAVCMELKHRALQISQKSVAKRIIKVKNAHEFLFLSRWRLSLQMAKRKTKDIVG